MLILVQYWVSQLDSFSRLDHLDVGQCINKLKRQLRFLIKQTKILVWFVEQRIGFESNKELRITFLHSFVDLLYFENVRLRSFEVTWR